ncbi:MAG: glycine cleavage system protein GcvH [Saprospiraceae bacterium]
MSKIEADLKYTPEHEWIKKISDTHAIIGITDFAQGELGELVYVEVGTVGKTLLKNQVFGTIEAVKTTSDLYLPVGGKIIEFNEALSENGGDNPGLINEDPYETGWIIKIEMTDPAEYDSLLEGDAYKALIN